MLIHWTLTVNITQHPNKIYQTRICFYWKTVTPHVNVAVADNFAKQAAVIAFLRFLVFVFSCDFDINLAVIVGRVSRFTNSNFTRTKNALQKHAGISL